MRHITLSLFCLFSIATIAQKTKAYKIGIIGFYNLENFYDTIDQPNVSDEEFTPNGPRHYNTSVYTDKIERLSDVLSRIGIEDSPDGLSLFGSAEIENESVLYDLVNSPKLKARNYKIVHYDSPDERGVDVALMYNPKYFTVTGSKPLNVPLKMEDGKARRTRDILWVWGNYMGEPLHVFVNHWPSRRGGEEASAPGRAIAAGVCKKVIDSLMAINPETKCIVMGDLNDDPISPSVAKVLNAKQKPEQVKPGGMFNPWIDFYKQGIGTLAYNDAWNLFDQIIISYGFLSKQQDGVFYRTARIFNRDFMVQKTGRFKGYPLRTWDGNIYNQGYSDHFPTYLEFLKEVK